MRNRLLIILVLIIVPLFAFGGVLNHQFVAWDDNILIFENPHLHPATIASIGYFWAHPYDKLYVPLTYGSYALLAMLSPGNASGGITPNPFPFHLLNLLLHLANTLLVFALLRRLIKSEWAAVCGALLWSIHPVQAEPVAWAAELKGILSAFFGLLAIWFYLRYADTAREGEAPAEPPKIVNRQLSIVNYGLATICFVAALLSKPSAVALPLVLWIIDRYFVKRTSKQIAKTLIPWLVICIPWVLLTQRVQPVTDAIINIPLWQRPFVAGDALAFYLGKILWPVHLVPDYSRTPHWLLAQPWHWYIWLVPAVLALFAWWQRRKHPQFAIAGSIGVAFLLPVLGLSPFHFQLYSTVADRYLYLPMLAPAFLLALLLAGHGNRISFSLVALLLLVLTARTSAQTMQWANSNLLFSHTLAVNSNSWMAYNNRASIEAGRGNLEAALADYQSALQLKPGDSDIEFNIGHTLMKLGRNEEAQAAYEKSLQFNPDNAKAVNDLGVILFKAGRINEAKRKYEQAIQTFEKAGEQVEIAAPHANLGLVAQRGGDSKTAMAEYQAALQFNPHYADAHNRLGSLLAQSGDMSDAEREFRAAIANDPKLAIAYGNLGMALASQGKNDAAIEQFQQAVTLDPADAQSQYNLGISLNGAGQPQQAIIHLREAVRLKPDFAEAYNDLGTALAKAGKPKEAITQLQKAVALKPAYTEAHYNLGLIYMADHQKMEAATEWWKALRIDPKFAPARQALEQNHLNQGFVFQT